MDYIHWKDLKDGDRVRVTVEGTWAGSRGMQFVIKGNRVGEFTCFWAGNSPTIERLPPEARPLSVGEHVKCIVTPEFDFEVVWFDRETAWISCAAMQTLVGINTLHRPDKTPISIPETGEK